MKVEANKNFIESLIKMNRNSISNIYSKVRCWIKYHINKNFFKVLKTVLKSYPWDESYLYELEQAKIEEMMKHHQKYGFFEGSEFVIRDMKLCMKLIDIFTEKISLFHYDGDIVFKKIESDDESYELGTTTDFKYNCDVYVNTKNIQRFVDKPELYKFYLNNPHELYELKAKYLYHKIRLENDGTWWN